MTKKHERALEATRRIVENYKLDALIDWYTKFSKVRRVTISRSFATMLRDRAEYAEALGFKRVDKHEWRYRDFTLRALKEGM